MDRSNAPCLRRAVYVAPHVVILLLLTTACTTQVTGHVSPIAHDYGAIEWHGLGQSIGQPFVAGPGHQAAIANDGKTTPEQFQERLAALPEDARVGTLLSIEVGLRVEGANEMHRDGRWKTGALIRILDADGRLLQERSVDDLPRDGNWLKIDDPPALGSGMIVTIQIIPGDGADAARLQYAVTPDRVPYGGWVATNADGSNAGGALLLRTTYSRNIAIRSLARDAIGNLRDGAVDDPVGSGVWILALAGLCIGAGWLRRAQPHQGA